MYGAEDFVEDTNFYNRILQELSKQCDADLESIMNHPQLPLRNKRQRIAKLLLGEKESPDCAQTAEVIVEPLFAITKEAYQTVREYTGSKVQDYVYQLADSLKNMLDCRSGTELAFAMANSSIVSVGYPLGSEVIANLKSGEILPIAIKSGIKVIGESAIKKSIAVLLAGLLVHFKPEKTKKLLGIIFNKTDYNFAVKDWRLGTSEENPNSQLYMDSGCVDGFPEETVDGSAVQLVKRELAAEKELIWGSVYFAHQNKIFRGVEGVMAFESQGQNPLRFAHHFAASCISHNSTNICRIDSQLKMKELYQELYRNRGTAAAKNLRLSADEQGNVISLLALIEQE